MVSCFFIEFLCDIHFKYIEISQGNYPTHSFMSRKWITKEKKNDKKGLINLILSLICQRMQNITYHLPNVLEKAMATHSSTLACKIPYTEESGGLQSMGSWWVGHGWVTSLSLFTFMHWRRKWQPTPVFLPGESLGQGSLMGCRLWVAQSRTRLKRLSSSSSRPNVYPIRQIISLESLF